MGGWVDRAERFEASFSLAARFDCVPDTARARVAQFLIKQHCGKTGILNMPGKPKDAAEMKKGFTALETMCTQSDGTSGKCSLMRASPTRRAHTMPRNNKIHIAQTIVRKRPRPLCSWGVTAVTRLPAPVRTAPRTWTHVPRYVMRTTCRLTAAACRG